jgi:hypothetical protein
VFNKYIIQLANKQLSIGARENNSVLGQIKVNEKSNEIPVIPELLKRFSLENSIISIDAISFQKKIVSKIIEQKAD